jgi:hypothetical protein
VLIGEALLEQGGALLRGWTEACAHVG